MSQSTPSTRGCTPSSSTSPSRRSATSRDGSSGRPPSSSPWPTRRASPALRSALVGAFGDGLFLTTSLPYLLELGNPAVSKGTGIAFVAERLGLSLDHIVSFGDGENDIELIDEVGFGIAVEDANPLLLDHADWVCPSADVEGVATVIETYLESRRMIDLKAARADPDAWRAALARKGAAEAFDALLACRRALARARPPGRRSSQPDEAQGEADTRATRRAPAAEGRAARLPKSSSPRPKPPATRRSRRCRIRRDPSAPDGDTEDDAEELRRFGDPPALADAKEASEVGRFELERAARLSGSRFGYLVGDTALLALALYRFALEHVAAAGFTPVLPPVLVREEAMIGTGLLPHREVEHLRARAGRALPHRHVRGRRWRDCT